MKFKLLFTLFFLISVANSKLLVAKTQQRSPKQRKLFMKYLIPIIVVCGILKILGLFDLIWA